MPIFELFSKRNKPKKEKEIYIYDSLPSVLRVQITYIWKDLFGEDGRKRSNIIGDDNIYEISTKVLCREFGLYHLSDSHLHEHYGYFEEYTNGFLRESKIDKTLDYIELIFMISHTIISDETMMENVKYYKFDDAYNSAVEEINHRFLEHEIGYQVVEGKILRLDNVFTHQEIIKPALEILSRKLYKGASEEFLKAHQHYRKEEYSAALNECLKAFESTMRIICDKRQWKLTKNATASTLINKCFEEGLVPIFWQTKFSSLQNLLISGVPTARNKLSGHGQGNDDREIPRYLAEYVLNLTASSILFLVSAEEAL